MDKKLTVLCITFCLMVSSCYCQRGNPCATLVSQDPNKSSQITAEEKTNISVPFVLSNFDCVRDKNFKITGFKNETSTSIKKTLACVYRIKDEHCYTSDPCVCTNNGTFNMVVKSVTRSDKEWIWESSITDISVPSPIALIATYPVSINQLTIEAHGSPLQEPVDQGDSVHVHCLFNEGNPVLEPTLLDRHGQVLESSVHSHGNMVRMSHQFHQVGCDDAGILSCEAPGATENKTATLLVRCPPKFVKGQGQNVSIAGTQGDITFDIRTHTNMTTGCHLTPLDAGKVQRATDCSQAVHVTGPPPDMTLTVHLVNMTIQDEGLWRLTVSNDVDVENADYADFWLVVQEQSVPASVSELSMFAMQKSVTSFVDQNTSVDVVCFWHEGNPPVTARLLDRHGVEMEGSIYSSGQIRYRFPAVGCQDAGLIRCEAPGASHNESVRLLVKCPPTFINSHSNTITVNSGQDTRGEFLVRTHTTAITECVMFQSKSDVNGQRGSLDMAPKALKCASFVELTGTPPDLVLILRLVKVRPEYEGRWQLNLTNEVGTGHVEFALVVREATWKVITGAGVAAFLLLVVIITAAVCLRKGRRHVSARQPAIELDVIERRSLAREGDGSAQSAHIYWDADPPASDGVDAAEETPPPARHRPGNPPADYLNPEPSRDETEEAGAEFNTVPFYQNAQIRNTGASGAAAESSQAVAINNSPPTATAASEYGNGQVEDRTDDNQRTGSTDTETDETGYMKYAPRLYENTGP